jgi:hypothetical protein
MHIISQNATHCNYLLQLCKTCKINTRLTSPYQFRLLYIPSIIQRQLIRLNSLHNPLVAYV